MTLFFILLGVGWSYSPPEKQVQTSNPDLTVQVHYLKTSFRHSPQAIELKGPFQKFSLNWVSHQNLNELIKDLIRNPKKKIGNAILLSRNEWSAFREVAPWWVKKYALETPLPLNGLHPDFENFRTGKAQIPIGFRVYGVIGLNKARAQTYIDSLDPCLRRSFIDRSQERTSPDFLEGDLVEKSKKNKVLTTWQRASLLRVPEPPRGLGLEEKHFLETYFMIPLNSFSQPALRAFLITLQQASSLNFFKMLELGSTLASDSMGWPPEFQSRFLREIGAPRLFPIRCRVNIIAPDDWSET